MRNKLGQFIKGNKGFWLGKKRPNINNSLLMKEYWKNHIHPMKGKKHTQETIIKIKEARKKQVFSKEMRKKMSERLNKMWIKLKNNPELLKIQLEKMSKALKGRRLSPSTEFKNGHSVWCKGIGNIKIRGEKHPFWRGGTSFEPYPLGWRDTFKEQIRYRDKYQCQLCGMPEIEHKIKLSIHHIDYDKKNCAIDNLITLCRKCHAKTNLNREYWIDYFKEKILV